MVGSPVVDMIEGQRSSFRSFLIVIIIIVNIAVAIFIIDIINGPFGMNYTAIGFLLLMGISPILFLICVERSQVSFFTGFKRAAYRAEMRGIPKYCPNCGGHIDLDEVQVLSGDLDVNCPYCGTRLK